VDTNQFFTTLAKHIKPPHRELPSFSPEKESYSSTGTGDELPTPPTIDVQAGLRDENTVSDLETLLAHLLSLEPHVQKSRPKKCAPIIEKIASLYWPEEIASELADLEKSIDRFRFKRAHKILKAITEKLKGAGETDA
jgi:hypothetical protein